MLPIVGHYCRAGRMHELPSSPLLAAAEDATIVCFGVVPDAIAFGAIEE